MALSDIIRKRSVKQGNKNTFIQTLSFVGLNLLLSKFNSFESGNILIMNNLIFCIKNKNS